MNPRTIRSLLLLFALSMPWSAQAAGPWSGGGPDLAWVTVLAQPTGAGGPLFAGTYGGGLWRSDDLGRSWVDVSAPFLCGSVIWSLAYRHYDLEDQLYVGTEYLGLWRTRSFAGTSWDDLNTGLQQNGRLGVRGIAIHPHDPQVLTLATTAGMWTSNTGGANWPDSLRWRGGETFEDVVVSPLAPVTIFALQSFVLYRSPDKGDTFEDIGRGLPDQFLFDLAFWPGSLDERYVVSLSSGVYRDDGSGLFQSISPAAAPATMRNYVIEPDAVADRIYLGSERGLWSSENRGGSWTLHNAHAPGIELPEIWAIQVLESEPAHLMLGSFRYGVVETGPTLDDWTPRNQGLRASWVEALDAWDGGVLAATAHGEVFLSTDRAASWSNVTGNLDMIRPRDLLRLPSGRWLITGRQGLWLSDDLGASWRTAAQPPAHPVGNRLLASGDDVYLGTPAGVWHSVDDGEHWEQMAQGLVVADYTALASALDGTLAFAARGDGIYLRRAGESEFVRVRTGAGLSQSYRDLCFRGDDSHMLFVSAASQLKLWQLEADGSSSLRMHLEEGLPTEQGAFSPRGEWGPIVERIYWDHARGALIAALQDRGIFRSDRIGAGWTPIDEGIRVSRVEDLAIDPVADRVYVGTLGSGVWGADLEALAAPLAARAEAPVFRLAANPVQSSGQIEFELPMAGPVEFTLYDLRGRKVRTIASTDFAAGARTLRWQAVDDRGRPLAAGRYMLRGRVGGRVESRGITILR